jgi:hypothetical protein
VVAVALNDPSRREIVLDTHDRIGWPDVYGDWACWGRTREDGVREVVLMNIETREERVLDDESSGARFFSSHIWGDRVVWSTGYGRLKEHRISTGATRVVLEDRELSPMYFVRVWENHVVFTSEPSSGSWDVYLVDLDTDAVQRISPTGVRQDQSDIHNGRVVWTDFRWIEGLGGGGGGGMHIFVYSIRTGRTYVLNPSAIGGSEPRIFDRTILWQGGQPGEDWTGPWVTRIGDI